MRGFRVALFLGALCGLNALSATERCYAPDFEALFAPAASVWCNGAAPLPLWYAVRTDGTAVTNFYAATARSTRSGMYRFRTADGTPVLGCHSRKADGIFFGFILQNTGLISRTGFELAFEGIQWGFRNSVPVTITCGWRVGAGRVSLDAAGSWHESAAHAFSMVTQTEAPEEGAVFAQTRCAPLAGAPVVAPGEFLAIRFYVPACANAPGVGLAKLRLTSQSRSMGVAFFLK